MNGSSLICFPGLKKKTTQESLESVCELIFFTEA